MKKIKVMSVFGTRPEAIKMAPLVKELARREGIESLCCVTAQHREMLDSVMQVFDLKADADLDIMTPRQTLSTITCKCLTGMDEVIDRFAPDMILVHGDTSTTFAGALSAFYHKVKIGHVEAGLRTYDKYSPYPEEMNRQLVTRLADLYFCPTENNRTNLARDFDALLAEHEFAPHRTRRNGVNLIYVKTGANVERLLSFMGAGNAAEEMHAQKAFKQVRNQTNRQTNCDTANLGKTARANAQTLKAIQEAEAYHGPSLIIGYAPCEVRSIKGGMRN